MYFPKFPIPFFVVDRPISLELLKYCDINAQNAFFGLMGHANTTKNFQMAFRKFPSHNIIKMVDSGVFTKEGCKRDYKELFSIYEEMEADFGIIIDILKNKEMTLKSAQKAIDLYQNGNYKFGLIGVAQGNSINDYVECYSELKEMGYDHIAIGGLLKKAENTARYVRVKDEKFLEDVLKEIVNYKKEIYPNKWLFTLGCYHPKRHNLLSKYNVFGADYKGWILNYKTPKDIIDNLNKSLVKIENEQVNDKNLSKLINSRIKLLINLKDNKKEKQIIEAKIKIIDKKTLIIRKDIANELNNNEYSAMIKKYERFLKMNKKEKQEHRFDQVKAYLYKNVFSFFKKYLLIISCSDKKSLSEGYKPAIDLYDGPFYKMIRKLDRQKGLEDFHISIISAKYGLLNAYDLIEEYNQKMTKNRANELNKSVTKELNAFLNDRGFEEILIGMGQLYRLTIDSINYQIPVEYANGRIGEKLSETKSWIEAKI